VAGYQKTKKKYDCEIFSIVPCLDKTVPDTVATAMSLKIIGV
jgi:hypothetical protein